MGGENGMSLRFQRRIRVAPGISVNLNKKSISTSIGRRGYHVTVGPKGTRTTVGIPGSALSYTSYKRGSPGAYLILGVLAIVVLGILLRV